MSDRWIEFRRKMPVAAKWAYLDHAAVSPLPQPAREAMERFVREAAEEGDTLWPQWARRIEEIRAAAARLLGAQKQEIALVRSTTEGINLVAEGYPWQPGENVVTFTDEFPSNQYPWLHLASRGVEVRRLDTNQGRIDLDRLADACDDRTRLVAVSWVAYASGVRRDLDALAEVVHRKGALLFVDAIQGLGVFPLDVSRTPIDFLAADGHKWMLGPEGAGLFFLRREHLDLLRPVGVGWNSVVQGHDFTHIELNFKPSAVRYEGGSPNMVGLHGLGASLDLLLDLGTAQLAERLLEITDLACQKITTIGGRILSPREGDERSGIVIFDLPGQDPAALRQRCLDARIVLSCRGGGLRISPHGYNGEGDLERLVEVLAGV